MSDIVEGLGTAAQGGFFARMLEPETGAKQRHPGDPEHCLNCGTELVGAYCHACGQSGHIHGTIGAFMHDLLHGALHFEGKLWRTLPMLVLRPGRLTRRYIEGARTRFISPMALFLFSVFLMFAIFQMLGLTAPSDLPGSSDLERRLETSLEQAQSDRQDLTEQLESLPADDAGRADLEARLAETDAALESLQQAQVIALDDDPDVGLSANGTGIAFIDDGVIRKWRENPSLMLYKLQANSYKFSWLLIPISIPFVWLIFAWKRRFKAYDHAIFVTYSLSFMTLLFITASVLQTAGVAAWVAAILFFLVPPVHLYKQLRGTYELSRFSAFWRLIVLSGFIWIIVVLFLQVLLLLGAF